MMRLPTDREKGGHQNKKKLLSKNSCPCLNNIFTFFAVSACFKFGVFFISEPGGFEGKGFVCLGRALAKNQAIQKHQMKIFCIFFWRLRNKTSSGLVKTKKKISGKLETGGTEKKIEY